VSVGVGAGSESPAEAAADRGSAERSHPLASADSDPRLFPLPSRSAIRDAEVA
jgi:hypothetical protein